MIFLGLKIWRACLDVVSGRIHRLSCLSVLLVVNPDRCILCDFYHFFGMLESVLYVGYACRVFIYFLTESCVQYFVILRQSTWYYTVFVFKCHWNFVKHRQQSENWTSWVSWPWVDCGRASVACCGLLEMPSSRSALVQTYNRPTRGVGCASLEQWNATLIWNDITFEKFSQTLILFFLHIAQEVNDYVSAFTQTVRKKNRE